MRVETFPASGPLRLELSIPAGEIEVEAASVTEVVVELETVSGNEAAGSVPLLTVRVLLPRAAPTPRSRPSSSSARARSSGTSARSSRSSGSPRAPSWARHSSRAPGRRRPLDARASRSSRSDVPAGPRPGRRIARVEHDLRCPAARDVVRAAGGAAAPGLPRGADRAGRGARDRDRRLRMPAGQALDSAAEGAAFGLFPIAWIVVNAVWIYRMTVASGHFHALRHGGWRGLRRPAHPGADRGVLVWRSARGARRLRRTCRDHRRDAHRARLRAAQGRGGGAHRQYGAGPMFGLIARYRLARHCGRPVRSRHRTRRSASCR